MLTSLFTEIICISDEKHTLQMGTNNQPFEFHQRPLYSAKGLIGMPVYFFQDKTRRRRSYWDASTFISRHFLAPSLHSADQFSTGSSHLTRCLTIL